MVGAGLVVALLHLQSRGVSLLGALSVELPPPGASVLPGTTRSAPVPLALIVAMVCIMQTSAVASTFPSEKGEPDDVSRNFAGVGPAASWLD